MKKFLAFVSALILLSTGSALALAETYVMLEKDGMVGVFLETDTKNPVYMTDIVVLSLPEADREMLQEGIRVSGEEAVRELVEDFGS